VGLPVGKVGARRDAHKGSGSERRGQASARIFGINSIIMVRGVWREASYMRAARIVLY
jgi:hypothetical protein